MSQEKIYCGNGKTIKTQFGDLMKLSFSQEDLQKMMDYAKENNGWTNAVLKERREPSERGTTHYVEIDTWKPNAEQAKTGSSESKSAPQSASKAEKQVAKDDMDTDDLPF